MNIFPSRREFLKRAALLASTTALAFPTMDVAAAIVPVRRTGGPFLRPSLNAFSFLEAFSIHTRTPLR